MKIEVLSDAEAVALKAATIIASEARSSVAARGRFILAVSGGQSPREMFLALVDEDVPWDRVQIAQVDERIAPWGHPDRNLTLLRECLLDQVSLRPEQIHAMPVDTLDLEAAIQQYSRTLGEIAGAPPVVDLVHLGLGADGHTASLVPGDPVLEVTDADIGLTGVYQGRHRMTMTYPMLNRSRLKLWVVDGADKADPLARLRAGDRTIPAGRVYQADALVLADSASAGQLPTN